MTSKMVNVYYRLIWQTVEKKQVKGKKRKPSGKKTHEKEMKISGSVASSGTVI